MLLHPAEVHLWLLELSKLEVLGDRLLALLDAGEQARAARFRFERDRDRFCLCRAAVRILLGRYLGQAPVDIRFGYGPRGKPFLSGKQGDEGLEFNLAHSADLGLLGVARGRRIGVDLEHVDRRKAGVEIAERFFSREEVDALVALPDGKRLEAFFSCWTRKEAYLKACGDGLSIPLKSFSMSCSPGDPPVLLRSDLGPEEVLRWAFCDLRPAAGYAAALAVEGRDWGLRLWRCAPWVLAGG